MAFMPCAIWNTVPHDYGDVCQAITELAVELKEPISIHQVPEFMREESETFGSTSGLSIDTGLCSFTAVLRRRAGDRVVEASVQGAEILCAEQRNADRTGLGLGLAFSRWGTEANDGRISARNLPARGCVFTVDLPRLPVPALAVLHS
jgi:hypothetical protein